MQAACTVHFKNLCGNALFHVVVGTQKGTRDLLLVASEEEGTGKANGKAAKLTSVSAAGSLGESAPQAQDCH
ncbi:hypothetical protein FKM82_001348 [Ascaphus truei]